MPFGAGQTTHFFALLPSSPSFHTAVMSGAKAKAASKTDAELIGITTRKDGDFSDWYQQVLKKGDMLDYYDVSGCYILKPWSYNVWQSIQSEIHLLAKAICNQLTFLLQRFLTPRSRS